MTKVIAERKLDFFGEDGARRGFIRFLAPKQDKARDVWACSYHIKWPGFDRKYRILGEDSLQALTLAMKVAPSVIENADDFKAGRIGQFGKPIRTVRKLHETMGLTPFRNRKP